MTEHMRSLGLLSLGNEIGAPIRERAELDSTLATIRAAARPLYDDGSLEPPTCDHRREVGFTREDLEDYAS